MLVRKSPNMTRHSASSPCSLFYLTSIMCIIYTLIHACHGQVNKPPEFLPGHDMLNLVVSEDTAVGSSFYTLKGRDPEGSRISYYMSGDTFSVHRDTGVVTLIRSLDREEEPNLDVIVTIIDEKLNGKAANTVSVQREVKVGDANDNKPHFSATPYSFTVSEATQPFTTVYEGIFVTDNDSGVNSQVTLECSRELTPQACDMFHVKSTLQSEGKYKGSISLKGQKLDFETVSAYQLKLIAKDRGGLTSTVDVNIAVQDVQDEPPKFLNAPYSITVNESTATDTTVLSILVRDGDATPLLRRPLKLEILRDHKRYFTLKHTLDDTWVIRTTQNALDREDPEILLAGGVYEFGLRAVELVNSRETNHIAFANVTVVIQDINDQVPRFNLQSFTVYMPEEIANGSAVPGLNLVVSDTDIGNNARFDLTIEDLDEENPASDVFSVSPAVAFGRTPVILKVANADLLDYEDDQRRVFNFNVVAVQGATRSSSKVTLILKDSNDHIPEFDSDQYHVQIPENMPSNMTVFTLTASDADSESFGDITYLLKGFGAEKFVVNGKTGDISVAMCDNPNPNKFLTPFMDFDDEGISLCLDHEAQPSYSLSYEARDGGGKHSTVNLFIEILDVNDNIPIFSNQIHVREVYDKETTISPPLILRATDADGPSQGGNGAIRYMLKDTNLTGILVDAITGEVKLTKPVSMEYEQNRATGIRRKLHYEAIVRAIDGGDPPLESEAKLVFHVKSERDGAPSFIAEPYNVSIPENSKPGSAVLQVKATDPDGPDSALRYAIVDGAKDNFVINSETGNILIGSDSNLDRDVFGDSYELVVSVVDSGFPVPLTSTCVVYIRIEDVNNKPPKFSTDSHVVYLTDAELIPNREIIKLIATDPDRSAKIRYSFDEEGIVVRDNTGFVLVNGNSMATSAFKIDHTTGSVKVGQKLDSSKASVISIPVMAVDVNAFNGVESPQFALTELTIYIRNEDAKNPIFAAPWTHSSPSYEISLSEETATGSTVLTMSAKDALTNRPIHEFEKIKETDPDNHFSVNPLTGIVTINKRLDFEELPIKQAKFSVRAIGTGPAGSTSRPSSIANVIVTVIDINDNSPVFTQDMYSASVLESAEWPQTIITVSATDADSGAYGTLNYAVSGDGSHLFEINRKTGLVGIKKNVTLDRETKSVYNLQVTATDNNGVHFDDDEVHLNPSVVQRRTSVLVSIRLQDSNDNAPIFERERYEAVVPENVPIGFVVSHIHATDVDEGLNGQITYEVVGFDDIPEKRRLFEINETTGILTVAASLSGKGRPDPYEVTIKANDGGKIPLSSEVTVSIVVGDISANDGIPLFVKPAENEVVYVSENANPGTFVYQVEAVDADNPSTQNGKVMYKFLEHEPHFEIDPLSGIITTATNKKQRTENYRLDREKKANYTIILVAFDLGLPPQESHRVLSIRLNDTDDNEPRFERSISALPVMFEVSENAPLGSEIAKVKAIDDDLGINAQVVYEIINGNEKEMFAMSTDSSGFGVVKSKKNLDKEVDDKFLLTIRALNVRKTNPKAVKYLPYEKNDFAQIQVEIHVKDVDDNKPQFSLSNYVVGSKYDVELFTPLITFKAVDPDKSDVKPRISYSISDAQFVSGKVTKSNVSHVFSLENASGILRNEVSLKSYLNGYFNLTILGQSSQSEGPFSKTFVNCKVFILREKDFLKFVFKRRPNEISKDLKKLEYDFGHAMASSPLKLSLNFDSTQYYQRKDGSLDFESSAACFQLIKSSDGGSDLVLDRSEGVKFLKADGSLPYNKSLKELYDTYDIVSVEECVVTKNNYSMSPSEMGLLVLASAIAVLGIFFAFLASGMKRTLKKRMAALGIVSGYNGPMFVGTNHPPINGSYGVPMSKASSFISVSDHQRIYEWQETNGPQVDAMSFRSFPTLRR